MIQQPGYAFPLLWLALCWSQVDIYPGPQITSLRTFIQPAFQWWPYLLRYQASNSQNCQQLNLQPQGSLCELYDLWYVVCMRFNQLSDTPWYYASQVKIMKIQTPIHIGMHGCLGYTMQRSIMITWMQSHLMSRYWSSCGYIGLAKILTTTWGQRALSTLSGVCAGWPHQSWWCHTGKWCVWLYWSSRGHPGCTPHSCICPWKDGWTSWIINVRKQAQSPSK